MRPRLLFNALQEQPRAFCHAHLTNIQKCLQSIFVTLYFVRSFFDYSAWQRFTLCSFFDYSAWQRFTLCSFFDYLFLQRFILR